MIQYEILKKMLNIQATVVWKKSVEGGLSVPIVSGIQPSFSVAGDLIISRIVSTTEKEMRPEIPYDVIVELPYGEIYDANIKEGMEFTLNVGSRVVATGIVNKKQAE